MASILTPPEALSSAPDEYARSLHQFVDRSNFPEELLKEADYLMLKVATPADFSETARAIQLWASETSFLEIDWRFLVAAQLFTPISVSEISEVWTVEVMEAKSPDGTADYIGPEYVQFYHPDFREAGHLLEKNRITHAKRTDGAHRWWQVPMNPEGQELRISDKSIVEIIDNRLDDGRAKKLTPKLQWPEAA